MRQSVPLLPAAEPLGCRRARLSLILASAFTFNLVTCFAVAQTAQRHISAPSSVQSTAPVAASPEVPFALTMCEMDQCTKGGGGSIWVFQGNKGQAVWHYGAVATIVVQQFDGHTIVMTRTDPPGSYSSQWPGKDGVFRGEYRGTVYADHIEGTAFWNGDAAHSGKWVAKIPKSLCAAGTDCPLDANQLTLLGANAYKAGLHVAAARSFLAAAEQGNSDAEAFFACVLFQHKSSPAAAFQWAKRSADANNGLGEEVLGRFYIDGFGTPRDPALGKSLMAKGEAQMKLEDAQAQQQARADAQGGLVQQLAIAAMVAAFLGGDSGGSAASGDDIYSNGDPTGQKAARDGWWASQGGGPGGAPPGWEPQ